MLLNRPISAFLFSLFIAVCLSACSSSSNNLYNDETLEPRDTLDISILALGDSYTVGTGVCEGCSFPLQLKDSLAKVRNPIYRSQIDIIARTGWTTEDLIGAINSNDPNTDYDLVTLLIGVNNQFQGQAFAFYESEFPSLLNRAISLADGRKDRVVVLSIPDYAFSSFGQNWGNPVTTSEEIDAYNTFAESICDAQDVDFLNITDISRAGLSRPELIASDGLHLSEIAYAIVVERLRPLVQNKLEMD